MGRQQLERVYGLHLPPPGRGEDPNRCLGGGCLGEVFRGEVLRTEVLRREVLKGTRDACSMGCTCRLLPQGRAAASCGVCSKV